MTELSSLKKVRFLVLSAGFDFSIEFKDYTIDLETKIDGYHSNTVATLDALNAKIDEKVNKENIESSLSELEARLTQKLGEIDLRESLTNLTNKVHPSLFTILDR